MDRDSVIRVEDVPVMLIASAGSGKTTSLVERYLFLLSKKVSPENIWTCTFTQEAARELKSRILDRVQKLSLSQTKLISQIENSPNIGTIHSYCLGLINRFSSVVSLPRVQEIIKSLEFTHQWERQYQGWMNSIPRDVLSVFLKELSEPDLKRVVREIYDRRCVNLQTESDTLKKISHFSQSLVIGLDEYFLTQGKYTFNDLERVAIRILDQDEVQKIVSSSLHYVLVDEYQDISPRQCEVIKRVVGEDFRKLFVVGDPKQSIYRFRGAEVLLFYKTMNDIKERGGIVYPLMENYRTGEDLLCEINDWVEKLFPDETRRMECGLRGDLQSERIHGLYFGKNVSEFGLLEDSIRHRLNASHNETIGVLFRVGDRVAEFSRHLMESGINVRFKRGKRISEVLDIQDILIYLKAVFNPLDDFLLSAFLQSSFVRMDLKILYQLSLQSEGSLFEKIMKMNLLPWFVEVIDRGVWELEDLLIQLFRNSSYFPKNREAVRWFISEIQGLRLEELYEWTQWSQNEEIFFMDEVSSLDSRVSLMTVHSAKGLEFDHVYLVDNLRKGNQMFSPILFDEMSAALRLRDEESLGFRDYQRLKDKDRFNAQEESKRLLYVALTRAKKSISILLPEGEEEIPANTWGHFLNSCVRAVDQNL